MNAENIVANYVFQDAICKLRAVNLTWKRTTIENRGTIYSLNNILISQ